MFTLLVLSACLALACCQTEHPHPTHPTHEPHATHDPNATHPTHGPELEHTFSEKNAVFIKDVANMAMMLKSDSGCYVTHLSHEEVAHIDDLEYLLHLESQIIHHLVHAHHFHLALNPTKYSAEVQAACPTLYAYHKEH